MVTFTDPPKHLSAPVEKRCLLPVNSPRGSVHFPDANNNNILSVLTKLGCIFLHIMNISPGIYYTCLPQRAFISPVLSPLTNPQRNGSIVGPDRPKSHMKRKQIEQRHVEISKGTPFAIQRQISKSNTLSLPTEIDVRKLE